MTKNPILKTLKNGDIVMLALEYNEDGQSIIKKQIVKLKNIKYIPPDDDHDFDWLEFDGDVLYSNCKVPAFVGNCIAIKYKIKESELEYIANKSRMINLGRKGNMDEEFRKSVEPAIRYLLKYHHPHTKIYIDYDNAELLLGEKSHNLNNEVPD